MINWLAEFLGHTLHQNQQTVYWSTVDQYVAMGAVIICIICTIFCIDILYHLIRWVFNRGR